MVFTRSNYSQIVRRSQANRNTKFQILEKEVRVRCVRTKPTPNPTSTPAIVLLEEAVFESDAESESESESDYEHHSDSDYNPNTDPEWDTDLESIDSVIEPLQTTKSVSFSDTYDFDEAHDEWMANKKRGPNGTYVYLCGYSSQINKRPCRRACCDKIGLYSGCKTHFMWEEKQQKLN
jgi:hypothetical protein